MGRVYLNDTVLPLVPLVILIYSTPFVQFSCLKYNTTVYTVYVFIYLKYPHMVFFINPLHFHNNLCESLMISTFQTFHGSFLGSFLKSGQIENPSVVNVLIWIIKVLLYLHSIFF